MCRVIHENLESQENVCSQICVNLHKMKLDTVAKSRVYICTKCILPTKPPLPGNCPGIHVPFAPTHH